MEKRVVVLEQERITKNTVRYQERPADDGPEVIGTLYVQKWALGTPAPDRITVTLEAAE